MRFRVLGPVEIESDDGQVHTLARRQERCLLAILLLEAGRVVPVDRLCDLLWDGSPPPHARRAVHAHVARIRAVLPRGGTATQPELVSHGDGYQLRVDAADVDAHRFRDLVNRAEDVADPVRRDGLLREALGLWRGSALHNAVTSERLRQRLCADLDERRLGALEASIATGLELGRDVELLPELARMISEHPVRERLVELHMLALYRQGRAADALDVYRAARGRLAGELGLDPGPELRRLHRAILRGEPAPEVNGPGSPPAADGRLTPAQLPADLAAFVGRTGHLDQLDGLLSGDPAAVVISAIAGTAGVGKTTLAVHWAHRIRDRFPDGQLYVNLRGFDPVADPTPPAEAIRRFLDALAVPARLVPTDPDAQVRLYRKVLASKRVLVVLDNARDPDQVRPLLPGSAGCLTLVTSRDQLADLVVRNGARSVDLDVVAPAEARQLLAARLGSALVDAEAAAVDEIVLRCAGLPLALAIVAARAATNPHLSLAALASELRDAHGRLDTITGDDAATDIRAVFACSHHALTPGAARLFRLVGLHPGPDVSAPAAASLAGLPLATVGPLLAELVGAHLLTEPVPGRYACHDLLRTYARERGEEHDGAVERRAAYERILDHYLHTAYCAALLLGPYQVPVDLAPARDGVTPELLADHEQAMAWYAAERSVLSAAIHHAWASGFDTHTWQLAWAISNFLTRSGHWQEFAATQQVALAAAQRLADPAAQARAHRLLAAAYLRVNRDDEAFGHFQHALDLYTRAGDTVGQANTHYKLAEAVSRQGRLADAIGHVQYALVLYHSAGDRFGEAVCLNGIGWLHAQLGDCGQTIAYCQQALAIQQELRDRDAQAATWDSLGYAHHHQGEHPQAIACYERALELFRERGDRYEEATTLTNVGDVYTATDDTDAALVAWRRALAILTELDHPDADAVRAKLP